MKKIVILGCENTHADAFLRCIASEEKYKDVQAVGVYSDDDAAASKTAAAFGVEKLSSFDAAVGRVDGVMVTARHGDNHYKYAAPYISSGVPLFIDKPITVQEDEAVRFMRALRAANVRVTGGSCVRHEPFVQTLKADAAAEKNGKTIGGYVRAPVNLHNAYGGFFFYAQHLTEIVSEIFGRYPLSVKAYENDEKITVIFRYKAYDVVGLFTQGSNAYYASVSTVNGIYGNQLAVNDDCFRAEFDEFYGLLCGKAQSVTYDDFIAPVFVMNAIRRSLVGGEEIRVKEFSV